MKQELKNKFLYIKIDCATRLRTNYLGVNVRFLNNVNKLVTKTLKIVETKSQHTAQELKALLSKVLEEFEVKVNNVLACITDNASNMVRLVKDLNLDLAAETEEQSA